MLNTTHNTHNTNNIEKIQAIAAQLTLEEEREVSLEEAFESIEGDYSTDFDGFTQLPEGMFFSNSNEEQKDSWIELRDILEELNPADYNHVSKVNELGDEVDCFMELTGASW